MERVEKLLLEQLNDKLDQIVISGPKKNTDCSKIKIRPIQMESGLCFQESRFIGTQVFHKNLKKDELIPQICNESLTQFRQLQLESETARASVLISKNGTITVKSKRIAGNDAKLDGSMSATSPKSDKLSHNRTKNYILKEGTLVPFLVDLGVQTKDGKIVTRMYDKYRQINRFLEYIEDVLPYLPKDRTVSILDFGCGKSYLTFAMYYYLKILHNYDLDVIGLDLKTDVIRHCNELAQKYGYDGLRFLEGDIKDYTDKEEIDMVVTLHACDTATDYAIAKAIGWNASVILSVPCCQHELNRQIKCDALHPALKYGLIRERMSALLTDSIRACTMEAYGYETQVLEFIDMSHTPKNILLRGIKKSGFKKKGATMEQVTQFMEYLHVDQTLVSLLDKKE